MARVDDESRNSGDRRCRRNADLSSSSMKRPKLNAANADADADADADATADTTTTTTITMYSPLTKPVYSSSRGTFHDEPMAAGVVASISECLSLLTKSAAARADRKKHELLMMHRSSRRPTGGGDGGGGGGRVDDDDDDKDAAAASPIPTPPSLISRRTVPTTNHCHLHHYHHPASRSVLLLPITLAPDGDAKDVGQRSAHRNDIVKLRSLLDVHGLRTSMMYSPRVAVSVYTDSCVLLNHCDGIFGAGKCGSGSGNEGDGGEKGTSGGLQDGVGVGMRMRMKMGSNDGEGVGAESAGAGAGEKTRTIDIDNDGDNDGASLPSSSYLTSNTTTNLPSSSSSHVPLDTYAAGKKFLISMLGLHPDLEHIERYYSSCVGNIYRLGLFCDRVKEVCPGAVAIFDNTERGDGCSSCHCSYKSSSSSSSSSFNASDASVATKSLIDSIQDECYNVVVAASAASFQAKADTASYCFPRSSSASVTDETTTAADALTATTKAEPTTNTNTMQLLQRQSDSCDDKVENIISSVVNADPRIRPDQLRKEYDRIRYANSTYSNALLTLFADAHGFDIVDVRSRRLSSSSSSSSYDRITIYLYDPSMDTTITKPPRFAFLPALTKAIQSGPVAIAEDMVQTFWEHLLRRGYFATDKIRSESTPELIKFFTSGLAEDTSVPMSLSAHFTPTYPLSLYIHGRAGVGKSSFVRNVPFALESTVKDMADPEILVRYVKQNLNKPQSVLELELDLRPNNNDLSVMSIIQGRRMTIGQTKPGLVVVGLEEMAGGLPNTRTTTEMGGGDPNQLDTCRLLSQRFAGRRGTYREVVGRLSMSTESNNTEGRGCGRRGGRGGGISGDASVVTMFTSNEALERPCLEALRCISTFENLKCVEMEAVSGSDRLDFATVYIGRCIRDGLGGGMRPEIDIEIAIPVGCGDLRPLVRHLRMLAFYVCKMSTGKLDVGSKLCARIRRDDDGDADSGIIAVSCCDDSVRLKVGSFDNLYPVIPRTFDTRTESIMSMLRDSSGLDANLSELSQIVDYYFDKALAPAVVVSNDRYLIKKVVSAVASVECVDCITGIDPGTYKMMKSLYDPIDAPNLRDDILKFGRGAYVAIELECGSSRDCQLRIREMIEDSPSMTAFSSSKSALYKEGLFFGVHIVGDITEQVRSRASLII